MKVGIPAFKKGMFGIKIYFGSRDDEKSAAQVIWSYH